MDPDHFINCLRVYDRTDPIQIDLFWRQSKRRTDVYKRQGDLSDKASGRYDIITANIVANAIISLAPAVPGLMAENATFNASGIIDSRKDEVIAALEAADPTVQEVKEKRGWECIICKKTN